MEDESVATSNPEYVDALNARGTHTRLPVRLETNLDTWFVWERESLKTSYEYVCTRRPKVQTSSPHPSLGSKVISITIALVWTISPEIGGRGYGAVVIVALRVLHTSGVLKQKESGGIGLMNPQKRYR